MVLSVRHVDPKPQNVLIPKYHNQNHCFAKGSSAQLSFICISSIQLTYIKGICCPRPEIHMDARNCSGCDREQARHELDNFLLWIVSGKRWEMLRSMHIDVASPGLSQQGYQRAKAHSEWSQQCTEPSDLDSEWVESRYPWSRTPCASSPWRVRGQSCRRHREGQRSKKLQRNVLGEDLSWIEAVGWHRLYKHHWCGWLEMLTLRYLGLQKCCDKLYAILEAPGAPLHCLSICLDMVVGLVLGPQ